MTLRPTDMLEIQSAIDAYERKFPRRPTPTAEVALAWRLGKKAWAQRQARMAQEDGDPLASSSPIASSSPVMSSSADETRKVRRRKSTDYGRPQSSGLMWLLGQLSLRWRLWLAAFESSDMYEDSAPLVQGVLRVGLWGVAAVVIVSVFLLGAVVGGFK
jgi:hypothetical protein